MDTPTKKYKGYTITATHDGNDPETGWGAKWAALEGREGHLLAAFYTSAESAIQAATQVIDAELRGNNR